MKRLLSILLTVCLFAGSVSVPVEAKQNSRGYKGLENEITNSSSEVLDVKNVEQADDETIPKKDTNSTMSQPTSYQTKQNSRGYKGLENEIINSSSEVLDVENVEKADNETMSKKDTYITMSQPTSYQTFYQGDSIYVEFTMYDTWKYYYTKPIIAVFDPNEEIVYSNFDQNIVKVGGSTTYSGTIGLNTSSLSAGTYFFYIVAAPCDEYGELIDDWSDFDCPTLTRYFYIEKKAAETTSYITMSQPTSYQTFYQGDSIYIEFKMYDTWEYYYTKPIIAVFDPNDEIVYSNFDQNIVQVNGSTTYYGTIGLNTSSLPVGTYFFYIVAAPCDEYGELIDDWSDFDCPTLTRYFYIEKKAAATIPISSCDIRLSESSYYYDGTKKNPDVTVEYQGTKLVKNRDYEVSYSSGCIEPGKYSVKISGLDDYSGSVSKSFTIESLPISQCTISMPSSSEYDGTVKRPEVVVSYGNKEFVEGKHYTVSYGSGDGFVEPGTYKVTISGDGKYLSGSTTKTYTIEDKEVTTIEECTITLSSTELGYTGDVQKPVVTVKAGSKILRENVHYTLSYSDDCIEIGQHTVTITGCGEYTGSATRVFSIGKISMEQCEVVLSKTNFTYDGEYKEPIVYVLYDGEFLVENEDYFVQYESSVDAGTYDVRVLGIGNYKGSTTVEYKIKPASITSYATSEINKKYTYKGSAIKPAVEVYGLTKNVDYKVSYSNNKKVGKAKVVIKGIGNYKGTITYTFNIIPKNTTISSVTGSKKAITVKWKKYTTQVTGYQVQYSTSSKFSDSKTKSISKNTTVSKKITGLKAKKTYYVRIRTYKKVDGKTYYSSWSKSRKVKTK